MVEKRGVLYSTGQLDCLSYYSKIFSKIKAFVGDRELATKTYIPESIPPFIVHRGSNSPVLTFSDIKITRSFLKKRVGKHLHDVEKELSDKEHLTWRYFVPRKLTELYYACNYEHPGKKISRIFIDLDAGEGISQEKYLEAVKELLKQIKKDKELKKLCSFKIKLLWTGRSVHVYLMLNKKFPSSFYARYFSFFKDTFTTKWANAISEKINIKVKAGHERKAGAIVLDTSATPSGKLARCPYSLHLSRTGELNGVSVPLKESQLNMKTFKELNSLTPDKALNY